MIIQTDYGIPLRSYRAARGGREGQSAKERKASFSPRFSPNETPRVFRRCVLTSSRLAPLVDSQEAGLERYAIAGQEADWSDALVGGKSPKSGLLSVKRKATAQGDAEETPAKEKKDRKDKKAASAGKKSKGSGKKKR